MEHAVIAIDIANQVFQMHWSAPSHHERPGLNANGPGSAAACRQNAPCGIDFQVQALGVEFTRGHLARMQHARHGRARTLARLF